MNDNAIVTTLFYKTDLNSGITMTPLHNAFLTGDEEAHQFRVTCYRGNDSVNLEGAAITGYFIRPDGVTLPIPGSVENNVAVVQLPAACYVRPGRFSLVIKAALGGPIAAILWAEGAVSRSKTDDVRDPLEKVPSLDELLAQIDRLEQAINKAETVANLTAEATTLAAGSAATAEYKNGKLTLGIPKGADGQKGDPGYTPVKGKDYFDGKDGYTPVKGKDYFDGEKGDPGSDASVTKANVEAALGFSPAGTLVGNTTDITPKQVYAAMQAGKALCITHTDETYGAMTVNYFVHSVVSGGVLLAYGSLEMSGSRLHLTLMGVLSANAWVFTAVPFGEDFAGKLIADTKTISPTKVLEAMQAGKVLCITHTDSQWGELTFNYFVYSAAIGALITYAAGLYGDTRLHMTMVGILANDQWAFTVEPFSEAKTPVKGEDYWTEEDQASMVQDVIAALPDASGVKY